MVRDAYAPAVLAATVLALGSATLHATWNLFIKRSDERDLASWGQFLFGGLLTIPVLAVIGLPPREVWALLVLSAVVHAGYIHALVQAYTHGDFSLAYPLARGGGAFLAAIGGVVLLGDHLDGGAWVAISVIVAGIVSLVGHGATRISIAWALATALTIAIYSLIDAHGAREAGDDALDGVRYAFALMPASAVTITVLGVARGRRRALTTTLRTRWTRYLGAGACLTAAYTMVLVAVRLAPVGYVTMLRESSIVIGAVAGWLLLHEHLGRHRAISSAVMAGGMVLLIAVR
jgi:drug/metabolite transporter (DMT)-like permease